MSYADATPRRGLANLSTETLTLIGWGLIAAAVIMTRSLTEMSADTSSGLSAAETLFNGGRINIDIVDINPPATIWMHLLPTWLAALTGITPEGAIDVILLPVALGVSFWTASSLTRSGQLPLNKRHILAVAVFLILTILPARNFGQREHVGVMLMLTWLALMAHHVNGRRPDGWESLAAHICLGLALVVKPHFTLAGGLVGCLALVCSKHRLRLVLGTLPAVAIVAAYVSYTIIAVPSFLGSTVPLVVDVYLPIKRGPLTLLATGGSLLLLLIAFGAARLLDWRQTSAATLVFGAACCGGIVSWLLQGKGWAYHSMPMLMFALIGVVAGLMRLDAPLRAVRTQMPAAIALAAGLLLAWPWFNAQNPDISTPIAAKMKAEHPSPRVAMLGDDISVAFPATRKANGTWVMRHQILWMVNGALMMEHHPLMQPAHGRTTAEKERYASVIASALREVRDDIVRNRPDIILVGVNPMDGFSWLDWARSDPALAQELKNFRSVGFVEQNEILSRSRAN